MNRRRYWQLLLALWAASALAQTQILTPQQSFLHPADSVCWNLELEAGDVLQWSLSLGPGSRDDRTELAIESSVDGEKVRREFAAGAADVRDELTAARAATYRIKLRTVAGAGRAAALGVWAKLGGKTAIPFPPPGTQRFNRELAAGDIFAISYDFAAPEKLQFAELFALEVPSDVVRVWMKTAAGDSLPAAASVKRWVGDPGRITLRGKGPQGGRITLRLEVEAPEDGEATIFVQAGAAPPAWVPAKARMLIEQRHDPWHAVLVLPQAVQAESLRLRLPDPPRALYAAQSLRARGLDSVTVLEYANIYAERDNLAAQRRERLVQHAGFDTLFLTGRRAFLPPQLHATFTEPLTADNGRESARQRDMELTWFVQGAHGHVADCRLFVWEYDEAQIAAASVPEEFFWDGGVLPLNRTVQAYPAAPATAPVAIRLATPERTRPLRFTANNRSYVDASRRVWSLYLSNPSPAPVYLVFRQAHPLQRPMFYQLSRWPRGAKILLGVLIVVAAGGTWAAFELRNRERRRRRHAQELAQELEKARQVQLKLLPAGPLEVAGLEIFGVHQSMQSVGGDYYDFFPLEDGRVIVCVADVTGHGLPAALLMANLQATLRAIVRTPHTLSNIAAMLNQEFYSRTSPENFVTMLIAEVSADRTMISYCNAGHNPGYVVRGNGDVCELEEGGIMLGAMESFPFVQEECGINRGDLVVFYTDGIPEAEIGHEDMFGYDRLKFFLMQERGKPLPDVARNLLRRVTPSGTQAITDDMALVLMRVLR